MNALKIENLSKKFKDFALENINLELPQGFIMGYVGKNGSGKTTTIKLIMEFLKHSEGEIKVFDSSYNTNPEEYKNLIGYIPDECFIPSTFKLKDVKDVYSSFYKSFDIKKFDEYVKRFNLPDNTIVKDFSKGMKIKLMFAITLSRKTRLLILDEPTSGLDAVVRDEILDLLHEYIEDGTKSVLFSTHISSDLEKIADYIYFIDNGKMVFHNTKDDVLEKFALIKGSTNDLTISQKEIFIGYKHSSLGFEALIDISNISKFDSKFLIEQASLDEIIVHHILKSRN